MMFSLEKFKKNKSNKSNNLDKPLLVLFSDGFGLLATVVDKQEGEVTIVASARSNISEPVTALVEVLGRLSVSFGKLPREAILLHAHAVPSILELAIENIETLESHKVQELVRWEMESTFADLVPHDNLGWLMIGLGYITEQQRDVLVKQLTAEKNESGKKVRIGDLAISQDYINRNQLEECLKVQDQMQLQDQRIKCGWSSINEASKTYWIATAISESIHQQWVSAVQTVSAKGVLGKAQLKSIYPYIGAGSSQLFHIYSNDKVYILELHRPYLALNIYRKGLLLECLVLECSSDTPQLNDVETLINNADIPEGTDIYTTVTHSDRSALREELETLSLFSFKHLEREVTIPTQLTGDVSSAEAIMIFGATFNYFSKSHQIMTPVQGANPPPPLYLRPLAKVAAMVLVLACVIGAIEGGLAWKLDKIETKLTSVKDKVQLQQKIKKDLSKSKKAQVKLDNLKLEYESLVELKKLMETVLVSRNNFMNEFLDMVILNMNDNLIIDSIIEQQWNIFVINGWSVDQTSVEYFSQGLSRDLRNWDMEITENPSELGRSDNGLSGYKFRFVIKKVKPSLINSSLNITILEKNRR